MKRFIVVALSITTLALAAALPVGADTVGDASPACADIALEGSNAAYHVASEPNNSVTGIVSLNDTSCRGILYEMWVSYTSGGQRTVRVDIERGNGVDAFVRFEVDNVFSDDGTVCVGFTTSRGPNLLDRAPDAFSPPTTGCVTVAADVSGGGSFW
jgi:hypothetical protein